MQWDYQHFNLNKISQILFLHISFQYKCGNPFPEIVQIKSALRIRIQNVIYDFDIYNPWLLWSFLVDMAWKYSRKSTLWQPRLKMTNQRKQKEEMNYSLYIWKHDWCLGVYFSRWGGWIIMRTSFSSLWEEGWQHHPCEWKSEGSRVMIPVMSSLSVRPTEVPWDACASLSPSLSHGILVSEPGVTLANTSSALLIYRVVKWIAPLCSW